MCLSLSVGWGRVVRCRATLGWRVMGHDFFDHKLAKKLHPGGGFACGEGAGGFDFFGLGFAEVLGALFGEPDLAVDGGGAAAFGGALDAVVAGDDCQTAWRVAGGDQFFQEFIRVAMIAGEMDLDALIFKSIREAGRGFCGVVNDGDRFVLRAVDLRSQKLEQAGSHPLERAAPSAGFNARSEDQVVAVDEEGHFFGGRVGWSHTRAYAGVPAPTLATIFRAFGPVGRDTEASAERPSHSLYSQW